MRRLGTILAERRLADQASGKIVRVSLGAPRPGTDGADWECPFRIHGAGISRLESGHGIDAMQALANALEGIRVLLDESGLALGWWFGPGRDDVWHGETGFARSIPIALGPRVSKRMERLFFREIRLETARLKRRAATRRTAKARKSRKAR